ncbi:MAG: hypothetical protein AB1567_09340 [bacterium]
MYKNENGVWCILESTLDETPDNLPEADPLTEPSQYFQYEPLYCFNNHHCWAIKQPKYDNIDTYLRAKSRNVNMKKIDRSKIGKRYR